MEGKLENQLENRTLLPNSPHLSHSRKNSQHQFLIPLNQDSTKQYSFTAFPRSVHLRRSNSPQKTRRVRLISVRILKSGFGINNSSLSSSPISSSDDYFHHSPKREDNLEGTSHSMKSSSSSQMFGDLEEWCSYTRSLIHPPEYTLLKNEPTYQWQVNLSSEDSVRKEYFPNEAVIIFSVQHKQYFSVYSQSQLQLESLQLQPTKFHSSHSTTTSSTPFSSSSSSSEQSSFQTFTLELSIFPSQQPDSKGILGGDKLVFSHIKLVLNHGIVHKLYLIETPQEDHKPITLKRLFLDGDEFNERKLKKHRPNSFGEDLIEEDDSYSPILEVFEE